MEQNVPEDVFPPEELQPDLIHTLPELHYPEQVNAAVELTDRHVANGRGENVAIYFENEELTYAELGERTDRLGNALRDLGVAPGDRVFVRFPNRPEYVISCLAAQKTGAVPLPSMPLLRATEIEHVLEDSGATAAVVQGALLPEVREADAAADVLDSVVVARGDEADQDDPGDPDDYDEYEVDYDDNDDYHDHHDYHGYEELIDGASPDLTVAETSRTDLAMVAYTSGTTGRPKGTIHTHRQMLAIADGYARYCLEPTEEDVFSGNPPIAFTFGYGVLVGFPLRFGASTAIIEDPTPTDLIDAVERYGVSVMASVPTAYNQMLAENPDVADTHDLSSLRLCVSAGEPLPESTYERLEEHLGVETTDGIGTTEMLHIFISHRMTDEMDPTATGFPVPGYECKVVDPDTYEEVGRGEAGLLLVRGPTGLTYWDRPDEQEAATHEGWSIPGDVFVHREDGRFEHKSRRGDLIITGGYNVPGPEVEGVLLEREEVFETGVVGSPDEERGKIVKAFVVPEDRVEPDDRLAEELQEHVKERIAPYKYPRAVEFIDELPKTETGKIRRGRLRDREERG
jgi:2-aminobenzoate-CoA ligase